ncbi:2-hydroxymuconic semialdehyde hydrolase [Xaviernesmea oryzae]|uniref:Palmitoyl-protein thioesterase ABHD10, mitochondrial n=1 Tax=Xaviernesmea oryzae TaxID=464029 RepID=A0A1Q9AUE8_9HYPH|nr:alpha/beta hydrolase [Xaviernesmea oryzae]OLP59079.1 2-hydroxymuconic semialdehyde hydrolase [Xaviernesmea oryzae]SEK87630.1 Pimeloyl-ACP methyl ester carboxylesterase [Xaviernesmea oryzae]
MTESQVPAISQITVGASGESRMIAYRFLRARTGIKPALVWLGGYRSDMEGTKALALEGFAREQGLACLRFDYSGHGVSGGDFAEGTISRWLEEAQAVIAAAGLDRMILVGSSMGGWIALRLVEELRSRGEGARLTGLVLIAPAPDFTSALIEPQLSDAEREALAQKGYFEEPSAYGPEPYIYTRKLIEDGRKNRVLSGMIETGCPVHVLQGMRDDDVPYSHALTLMEHLACDDVVMTLIRDGDHRLSRPEDLERMRAAIEGMLGEA